MTDGFPPMRYFMGTARRCRCCHFSSRLTTECPDNIRVIPVPACVIFLTSATTMGTRLPQTAGRGDGQDCIFARRYVAQSRGAVDPSGKCSRECAHCAAGGHLRANACAQRHRVRSRFRTACSCTGSITDACPRSCADIRNTYATAANTYDEPHGSGPPAR